MPTLSLNQPVRYFPGDTPASDVEVKIYDVDKGGNGDDLIYNGTTNSNGQLVGTTSNWQDRNTIRVSIPYVGTITQEIPDVPIFMVRLKEGNKDTGRVPFVPGAPIILPWAAPVRPMIRMKGKTYDDADELDDFMNEIIALFRNKTSKISFEVRAPDSMGLHRLAGSKSQIEDFLDDHLPAPIKRLRRSLERTNSSMAFATSGFDVLLVLVAFVGAAILTIASAAAIVWVIAQLMGYNSEVEILSPTSEYPIPGFKFKFTRVS